MDSKSVVIDMHAHIMPKTLPDYKKKFGYSGFVTLRDLKDGKMMEKDTGEIFRKVGCNCYDAKTRIEECDKDGVTMQVLSTIPVLFNYWAKPEDTAITSRYLNDHMSEVVKTDPTRFIGLGTLPMNSTKLAIEELEYCMKKLGLHGVQIGTNVNGKNLDDPDFFPLYERMEELNAVVFVHPWDMIGQDRTSKYWLTWLLGMPSETAISICSLLFGGVFEKFPKLKFVFAHGGGSFIGTLGRIQKGFDVSNSEMFPNRCSPRKSLGNVYVDSVVHDEDMLLKLIKELGADHILYGTDYPFPLGESYGSNIVKGSKEISSDDRSLILWKNAATLFNLKFE